MDYTEEDIQRDFAENLKKFREQSGLSQMRLAIEADLSPNYINELEQGRRSASFDAIAQIAAVLGVKPYKFFLKNGENVIEKDNSSVPDTFLSRFETCLQAWPNFKTRYSGKKPGRRGV